MFFVDLHNLHGLIDDEGRPLDEQPTASAPFVMRTCPYAGSRFQHRNPMNVSALSQMTTHWDATLDALQGIRAVLGTPAAPSVMDLLDVCAVAAFAPVALSRRGATVIPSTVAALHKLVIGIQNALHVVLLEDAPVSLKELTAFIEDRGLLIGDDEVCAGPPQMIEEALAVLIHGRQTSTSPTIPALITGRLGNVTQLAAILFSLQSAALWNRCRELDDDAFADTLDSLDDTPRPPLARFEPSDDVISRVRSHLHHPDVTLSKLLLAIVPSHDVDLDLPIPKTWRSPVLEYIGLEKRFLAVLERIERLAPPSVRRGPAVPEGALVSAWLGPNLRDVVEQATGVQIQNSAGATWVLRPD